MDTIFLSRRNLLTLLSKLDRRAAVEDEEYYVAQDRPAGAMHPSDEKNTTMPSTGIGFQQFVEL